VLVVCGVNVDVDGLIGAPALTSVRNMCLTSALA
jgi:hypothetical protein